MHRVHLALTGLQPPRARRVAAALAIALVPALTGIGLAAGTVAGGGILPAWIVPLSPPYSGTVGAAHHLSFIGYPDTYSNWQMGSIQVAVKDAAGHTVRGDTRLVVLSLNENTRDGVIPVPDLACADGLSAYAVDGVATFPDCVAQVDLSRLRITAAATGLPAIAGRTFALSGPPTRLSIGFDCNSDTWCPWPAPIAGAGRAFVGQPRVGLYDELGRRAWFTHTTQLTLSIMPGTPTSGGPGTLTCSGGLTITAPAQGRRLMFDGCAIDAVGSGYRLMATSSEGFIGYSYSFDVLAPGQPAQIEFLSMPDSTTSRSLGEIQVAIEDAWGNVVTTDSRTVWLREFPAVWTQEDTFNCVGGTSRPAVNGIATFTCNEPTFGWYCLSAQASPFSMQSQWYEVANQPPSLWAEGGTVEEGQSITLVAHPSDPDGYPLTVAWDLDGNGTFETLGATAAFSAAGLTAPLTKTVPVRVTDDQGASATATATVNVVYPFRGFVGLEPMPAFNTLKAGQQVSFRFSIDGNRGLGILDGDPYVKPIACPGASEAVAFNTSTKVDGTLRYTRGIDEYTYQWRTDKAWAGTCLTLVLPLKGGYEAANFSFR